jgi:tetratricopeptide (TPR) repeat protein
MSEARAVYRQAFQRFVRGEVEQAADGYREALRLDPQLAIAWNGLAMALERLGDLDGAIAAAKELVALEPDEALGHTSLSMFYQRKGMIPEAEQEKAVAARLTMKAQRR